MPEVSEKLAWKTFLDHCERDRDALWALLLPMEAGHVHTGRHGPDARTPWIDTTTDNISRLWFAIAEIDAVIARNAYKAGRHAPAACELRIGAANAARANVARPCYGSRMLVLRCNNLDLPGVSHGFFGRRGGVSEGIFASLNCGPGSGDDRAKVVENRRRAMEAMGGARLVTLYQIHSARVVSVVRPWEIGEGPEADAMVTDIPGVALGILTADCVPVLFADAEAGVVGAAHAGWRGALAGVTDSAIAAMEKLGAVRNHIAAAIGPCIAQASYEVNDGFRAAFLKHDDANGDLFALSDRPGHFRFDLEAYVAQRLERTGIGNVERLAADTYAREDDFYSYRRATHRGEANYGRQLAAIALAP